MCKDICLCIFLYTEYLKELHHLPLFAYFLQSSVICQGTFRNAKGPTSVLVVRPNPQRALAPRHSEVASGHTKQQIPGILKIKALAVSQLWMQGGFSNLLNTSQHLGMTSFAQSGFLFEKTHQPWKSPNTLLPEG